MQVTGYHGPDGIGAVYEDVFLVTGKRTPFGDYARSLARVSPTDLAIIASRGAIRAAGVEPAAIDRVIFANVGQSSADAYYLARHVALYCGLPYERPAMMVQRLCGSGFESLIQAAEQIALGKGRLILAGGTENMSLNPTAAFGGRLGHELGQPGFVDMLWASLLDPACGCTMGQTAENLAEKYRIPREEVDRFALASQEKTFAAQRRGFFEEEIEPVRRGALEQAPYQPRPVKLPRGVTEVTQDEHPRETSLDKLAQLPPVFRKNGVQTAGNSSGIVDGACAMLVASGTAVRELGLKPLGRLVASATAGVSPEIMGIGPAPAVRIVLKLTGRKLSELPAIEINEAFGAQCLAVVKELDLDPNKVNPNGGAIAIGHPLAATGTRLTLTLLRHMREQNLPWGIATACIGGGQGTAVLVEPI